MLTNVSAFISSLDSFIALAILKEFLSSPNSLKMSVSSLIDELLIISSAVNPSLVSSNLISKEESYRCENPL